MALAGLSSFACTVVGQTQQFDGNGSATTTAWSTAANWQPDGIPTATSDVLFDNVFRNPLQNIQLGNANRVANSITLSIVTTIDGGTWGLGGNSTATAGTPNLTLTSGNITRLATANSSTFTIGAISGTGIGPASIIQLVSGASGFSFTNNDSDGTLAINAVITGTSKTVTTAGPGLLVFSGANTYTGTTAIDAGTLRIDFTPSATSATFFVGNGGTTATAASLILGGANGTGGAVILSSNISINPGDGTDRTLGGTNTSGTNTFAGLVQMDGTFGQNRSLNLTAASGGTVSFTNTISGAGQNVTKIGLGTALLSHSNTFSGTTVVNAGTLNAGAAAALGSTSGVTVNSGGTLLLSNGGTTDRINNSASVSLGSGLTPGTGGILNTGGLSEGTAPTGAGGAGGAVGALTLILNTNSMIDFTSANGGSNLVFQNFSLASGTAVTIAHWTGTANANGLDKLLFATNPGYTLADLANVQFTNDAGSNFDLGARLIDFNGYSELVPVPEPSTWIGGALAVAALGWSFLKKLKAEILKS